MATAEQTDIGRKSLEERVARIEGTLEQMDKRIDYIGVELSGLRSEMGGLRSEMKTEMGGLRSEMERRFERNEERFSKIDERFTEMGRDMKTNFRWIVGINIMMWVTIIIAIIFR